jgi:flagellar hook-length control protein FliK
MDISTALPLRPPANDRAPAKAPGDEPKTFTDELHDAVAPDAKPAEPAKTEAQETHHDDHVDAADAPPPVDGAIAAAAQPIALIGIVTALAAAAPAQQTNDTPAASAPIAAGTSAEPAAPANATIAGQEKAIAAKPFAHPNSQTAQPQMQAPVAQAQIALETVAPEAVAPANDAQTTEQPQAGAAQQPLAKAPDHILAAMQAAQSPASAPLAPQKPAPAKSAADGKKIETAAGPALGGEPATQTAAASQTTKTAPVEGAQPSGAERHGNDPVAAFAHALTQGPAAKDIKPDQTVPAAAVQTAPAPPPAASAPAAATLVPYTAPVLVPPDALAATIARKALDGANRFEIRLDPAELGRLDVTIEVDETGHTRAHIRAERPEALELLQRDAKGMEQALRQAGLQTDQSSLSFSLAERHKHDGGEHAHHGRRAKFLAALPPDEIAAAAINGRNPAASGLDLRV